jgi:hypothetical protein
LTSCCTGGVLCRESLMEVQGFRRCSCSAALDTALSGSGAFHCEHAPPYRLYLTHPHPPSPVIPPLSPFHRNAPHDSSHSHIPSLEGRAGYWDTVKGWGLGMCQVSDSWSACASMPC